MAADILLHDADEVPVGEDQTPHVELARDVANRFNTRYGRTFVVPRAVNPAVAARVMDLADPTGKMGKSSASEAGLIYLLDKPDVVRRKVAPGGHRRRQRGDIRPVPQAACPTCSEILAACERDHPDMAALRFDNYGELKEE